MVRSYPARYLLPGHTGIITGRDEIKEVLGNFKDAIDYVLTETLAGMNKGKSADTLACEIRLPEKYANLAYLGEYYGCIDWTVRTIYTAYLGWFDGNPTRLHPLSPAEHGSKTIAMMGGPQAVKDAARDALGSGEYQWCLELCDLLMASGDGGTDVCLLKADALEHMAEWETSANGRHYYISCAHELKARCRIRGKS